MRREAGRGVFIALDPNIRAGLIPDLGTVALIVTACGIGVAVALFWAVRGTPLRFLFERPAWARLADKRTFAPQRGE